MPGWVVPGRLVPGRLQRIPWETPRQCTSAAVVERRRGGASIGARGVATAPVGGASIGEGGGAKAPPGWSEATGCSSPPSAKAIGPGSKS